MMFYTKQELDYLARSGSETLCFKPGQSVSYDVENFKRIPQRFVKMGRQHYFETRPSKTTSVLNIPSKYKDSRPYTFRLSGFRRESLFGPDEIAALLKEKGFNYADGIGNGLFETLLLSRKYGIWPVFEAPALGFTPPFLKSDFKQFAKEYLARVQRMRKGLELIEGVLGKQLIARQDQPWILWLPFSPLSLYVTAVEKKANKVADEMDKEIGIKRVPVPANSTREKLELARFWGLLRKRHMEVLARMAEILRREIVGKGLILGNMHLNPTVDYGLCGKVFDIPGVAVRPCYLPDKDLASANVSFSIKLVHDLTGKRPYVSVRSNLLSAGSRFTPGRNMLHQWYSNALRSGASGFYYWVRDYHHGPEGMIYSGPMVGNPDKSTRGKQRWQDNLDILSRLKGVRRFIPPQADIAILTASRFSDAQGWSKVFKAYCAFDRNHIWSEFLDIEKLSEEPTSLNRFKLVVIPYLPFCNKAELEGLRKYLNKGGSILTAGRRFCKYDLYHQANGSNFESIPLNQALLLKRDHQNKQKKFIYEPQLINDPKQSLSKKLVALCKQLKIDDKEWVYKINVDNIRDSCGVSRKKYGFTPDDGIEIDPYFYEHSSDWILPYISSK